MSTSTIRRAITTGRACELSRLSAMRARIHAECRGESDALYGETLMAHDDFTIVRDRRGYLVLIRAAGPAP